MEIYLEANSIMKNRKNRERLIIVFSGISVFLIILGLFVAIYLSMFAPNGAYVPVVISGVILALAGVFLWLKRDEFVYDYDYILVNGEVKVVKVINGKKRKLKYDFRNTQITLIGRFDSESFKRMLPGRKTKPVSASANGRGSDSDRLFYISYNGKKGSEVLILECGLEFIMSLMRFCHKSVLERDFK